MIDRFTQKAREAIRLAVETAQELEHGYVGTEHLLLGLIKEGTGVAAAVLAEHDVTEERVMELMERLCERVEDVLTIRVQEGFDGYSVYERLL